MSRIIDAHDFWARLPRNAENITLADITEALGSTPTVDVEPKWTPVSEGLPNELERVLITVRYDNDRKDRVVQVGSVYTDRFGALVWDYTEEYGFCKSKVLAWMPLPKAYGKMLPSASELMLNEMCQEEEQDG